MRVAALIALAFFCLLISPSTQSIEAWGKTYLEGAFISAFVLWKVVTKKSIRIDSRDLLLCVPCSVYISIILTGHFGSDLFLATLPAALLLGFFIYILVLDNLSKSEITRTAKVICIAFGAVCVYYFFFTAPQVLLVETINFATETIRYSPVIIHKYAGFGQPNNLASFAAAIGLLSYLIFATQTHLNRLCRFTIVSFCAFVVFDTGSKIGAIGLILGVLLTILFSSKINNRDQLKFLLLPVAIGLGSAALDLRTTSLGSDANRSIVDRNIQLADSSFQTRLDFLDISHGLWQLSPLTGHGLDTFSRKYRERAEDLGLDVILDASHPHNIVADLAVELGLVGIILIFGAICLWVLLQIKSRESYLFAIPIVPFFLHTMTEFPQEASLNHWALFGIIMILARQKSLIRPSIPQNLMNSSLLRLGMGSISFVGLGLCIYISTALYLVTKQNLYYEQIHPIKVIVQDAMSPYGRLPFVSHKTDRLVAEKGLEVAIEQGNKKLAAILLERYSVVLNYWGYRDGFELERQSQQLKALDEIEKDSLDPQVIEPIIMQKFDRLQ